MTQNDQTSPKYAWLILPYFCLMFQHANIPTRSLLVLSRQLPTQDAEAKPLRFVVIDAASILRVFVDEATGNTQISSLLGVGNDKKSYEHHGKII